MTCRYLHAHLARDFEVRSRRRSEAQHKLAGVDLRKQFGAELHAAEAQKQAAANQVGRHNELSMGDNRLDKPLEACLQGDEQVLLFRATLMLFVRLENPHAHDRHQRAGQQIRRDHRETDRQRQRHEQRAHRLRP